MDAVFEEVLAHRREWQEGATEVAPAFEVKLKGGGWSLKLLEVCQDASISRFPYECVGAVQTSFVGSIAQQPVPIPIYPGMDRQMHIGWPVLGCTRCSLSTMASWSASGWRQTGFTTLLLFIFEVAALAALGGSGRLWLGWP